MRKQKSNVWRGRNRNEKTVRLIVRLKRRQRLNIRRKNKNFKN
jgi:hypothetical protein